jgi:hypothetical protein
LVSCSNTIFEELELFPYSVQATAVLIAIGVIYAKCLYNMMAKYSYLFSPKLPYWLEGSSYRMIILVSFPSILNDICCSS